jgi:hypothetical protein
MKRRIRSAEGKIWEATDIAPVIGLATTMTFRIPKAATR